MRDVDGALDSVTARKLALRDQLLTRRNRLSLPEVGDAARSIAEQLLATAEVRRAATVAAYASVGTEPGTTALLETLLDAGRRVILPVLMPGGDLDWAVFHGDLMPAGRGLLEPAGPRLGPDAIATADAVLTPGLAVDRTGMRLGRGGGSYDRALARVPVGTFTCTLLYDEEVLDEVPADDHDQRVLAAVTPRRLIRFRVPG